MKVSPCTGHRGLQDHVDDTASILDKEKIAHGRAVAMHTEVFVEQHAGDESGNDLLERLHRPEIVEGTNDHRRNLTGGPIGIDEPISAAFGAGVRAHWIE